MSDKAKNYDIVMVGAGPSALAAAVYTTREGISTLLIEKGVIGGLAAITDQVDNYPGFSQGVSGLELAEQFHKQAERFGAEIELGEVTEIIDEGKTKLVKTTDNQFRAKAVLIATGSDYKRLGVPGEEEYFGRGVHFCATCDGAFYKDRNIISIGGGNSSAQESLYMTRFAKHIDVLVRGEELKASDVLVKKMLEDDKITIHLNTVTDEIVAENGLVCGVKTHSSKTNKSKVFKTDGVFVFIGLLPNTGFLQGSAIELDERGFIKTNANLMTSMKGVFASGDVRSGATLQIASAAGEGATAALKMREYIED